MEFLGMGMWEILLILIIALIIFGPGRIPEMARQAGKLMRILKQTTTEVTTQIQRELEEEEKALKASLTPTTPKPPTASSPAPSAANGPKPAEPIPFDPTNKPSNPASDETSTTI